MGAISKGYDHLCSGQQVGTHYNQYKAFVTDLVGKETRKLDRVIVYNQFYWFWHWVFRRVDVDEAAWKEHSFAGIRLEFRLS